MKLAMALLILMRIFICPVPSDVPDWNADETDSSDEFAFVDVEDELSEEESEELDESSPTYQEFLQRLSRPGFFLPNNDSHTQGPHSI